MNSQTQPQTRLSLSTNWCTGSAACGEEVADRAIGLGFGEIELGYNTPQSFVPGIISRLDAVAVGSVHAFCPVPLSAPCGYPELYPLASFDPAMRKLSRIHVLRNVDFTADMGGRTLVLHAGRVGCGPLPARCLRDFIRRKNGLKMVETFVRELEALVPRLEERKVVLALENLPSQDGFPSYCELKDVLSRFPGGPVRGWFDTGHDFLRRTNGWEDPDAAPDAGLFAGMHLNDVVDGDDHLPPGEGKVDFVSLCGFAKSVGHVVFEPRQQVSQERLLKGVEYIKKAWNL